MLSLLASHTADHGAGVPAIVCTILLIATVIAVIIGLLEVLGLYSVGGNRIGAGRFSGIVVAVILLVIYVVLC